MRYRNAVAVLLCSLLTMPCLLRADSGAFGLSAKRISSDTKKLPLPCGHIDKLQSMTIQINVRNLAKTNATIKLQWYFIGKKADTGKEVIFSQGEKTLDLKPSGMANENVESGSFHITALEHSSPQVYADLDGYLVVATDSAGNTRCDAARPPMKDLIKTAQAMDALKKRTQEWKAAGGGGGG